MAYSKKASGRYRRTRRTRRYTRRRRYRRKYPRRSGKRFPRGTEVKSKSMDISGTVNVTSNSSNGVDVITYFPGHFIAIGGASGNNVMTFPQGTNQGQRVGVKIEPIKLRISGAISLTDSAAGNINSQPNFWQVRLLVYQVKGGNASINCIEDGYHQLALTGNTGNVIAGDMVKLVSNFAWSSSISTTGVSFTGNNWRANNALGKLPLRRGIGSLCRVLYKKTFWINTQKNPIKQFRFITKTPKRLVYPESALNSDGDQSHQVCNDAIYILWMFQPGSFELDSIPQLYYNYHVDMFYTDK